MQSISIHKHLLGGGGAKHTFKIFDLTTLKLSSLNCDCQNTGPPPHKS